MINQRLYDGNVEMSYDPTAHLYTVNDVIVPGVTTVLGVIDKPALIPWAVRETVDHIRGVWLPDKEYTEGQIKAILSDAKSARFRTSQKALTIGSDAHDWVERYIKSRIFDIPPPELPEYPPVLSAATSYIEWENSVGTISYITSERRVASLKYMYSGTVDIMMRLDSSLVVADIKTSKAIYPEYYIQCAAYAKAIEEEDGISIDKIAVIRIPKDGGSVEVEMLENIDYLFGVFRACLVIWRWKNNWSPTNEKWQRSTE